MAGTLIYQAPAGDPQTREILTPGDTSTGISSTVYTNNGRQARYALIVNRTNTAMYCIDGTDPTASDTGKGFPMTAYTGIELRGITAIKNFRCIDHASGVTSSLEVVCFF